MSIFIRDYMTTSILTLPDYSIAIRITSTSKFQTAIICFNKSIKEFTGDVKHDYLFD